MIENSERYPLTSMLTEDLLSSNKLVICLFVLILCSALGTIWITHKTRALVMQKGELLWQHQALENEYLSLKLEEATQSDNNRIEAIAKTKLKMDRINPEQEVLLVE
ncbi:cell division protein FtsL [Avibacterium sp. 21-586]|uniref:cell division protein FtsL n=1 Tax=Avibacterium sp. 21-586 TaxID=2911534 RepID=UPI002247A060|nr:cell division protein FtsL [Avibacterium sp. 21-586]MCW9710608.1 cell division protein FtsL [Avibacterium sp. 21-586]